MRVVIMIGLLVSIVQADDAPLFMTKRGAVLFADDFGGGAAEKWQTSQKSFAVVDGVLRGGMTDTAHHPAIAKASVAFRDSVLQFDFRLDGAKNFSMVYNDVNFQGSH